MKFILALLLGPILSTLAHAQSNGFLEAWKGFSDPEIFSSGFTHVMKDLPMEGSIEVGPRAWSGDYWSSKNGGINYRWNAPVKDGWDYKSPSRYEATNMSVEQLKWLSPSEKFDLLMGRYDYPLREEVKGSTSRISSDWAGICNGWAPATLYHNEPTPKTMTNPDGIQVPFGSADIKALISYFYAFYLGNEADQIGLRCFFGRWMGGYRGCDNDLNAGAFHIVITNKIGLQKEGFIMDVERFKEVWNQPVVAYKSVVLADNLPRSRDAAETAVKEMRISTDVYYVDESDPTWNTVHGTKDEIIAKREFQYRIELNSQGKIVGGDWESFQRPDFIWHKNPARPEEYKGLLQGLPQLLND